MDVRLNTDGNRFDAYGNRLETRVDTVGNRTRLDTIGNRLDTRVDLLIPDNQLLTDGNFS